MADSRAIYTTISRRAELSAAMAAAEEASDPDPAAVPGDVWEAAEEAAEEIISGIRPTVADDQYRREVVDFVRGLITETVGCEVFPYGSAPLKTYLPDGDIDLTAISTPNIENTLCSDVYAVLKRKERNKSANFEVKDVYFINAEVKIVKCLVQNVVIDISFNQLGGLCTLCFLEKVDGIIGNNHLFKRSIIIIKCWCFYESRILGAHHGLLSTYALETLVLHVFHLFHSSLNGPLAVLYRFLDYFSKFDWENYCVSLRGAVCRSSLPDIVVKVPENGRDNLLLSEEFLQDCVDMFSAPSKGTETNSQPFPQKHLNIIDALKENNNLGRSVSKGNFHRIRSALKYGARKLGQILLLPREKLADELNHFFMNTLERQKTAAAHAEHSDTCHIDKMLFTAAGFQNDKRAGFENIERRLSLKMNFSKAVPEMNCTSNRKSVSGKHFILDAKETVSAGNGSSGFRTSFSNKEAPYAPHGNGKIQQWGPYRRMPANSIAHEDMSFAFQPESDEKSLVASNKVNSYGNNEYLVPNRLALFVPPNMFEYSSSVLGGRNSVSNLGNSVSLNSLLDLSGHYESYFNNLTYSKQYRLSVPGLPSALRNQFSSMNIWESIQQSPHLEPRACTETKASSGVGSTQPSPQLGPRSCSQMKASDGLGPESYLVNPPILTNASFSSEEQKEPRRTGKSASKKKSRSKRSQLSSRRGRFSAPGSCSQLQRHAHKNSLVTAPNEANSYGEGSPEFSLEEFPVLGNRKSASSDFHQLFPSVWHSSNVNIIHKLSEVPFPEESSSPSSDTPSSDSISSTEVPVIRRPDVPAETTEERDPEQLFHLKNEVDFPPLSLGKMVKT